MSSTKNRTSGGVMAEIERIRKTNTRRNEKIAQLRREITADNAKIKELEKLYETLNQAELQHKISKLWFRDKKLTDEQVLKLLELGEQIGDRIDMLDTSAIVDAIASVAGNSSNSQNKKQTAVKPTPKADEPSVDVPDEPQEE
ncbi:MAG: hypothetical protein LBC86_02720 [Oscillospiraceae bacterium]|jgi:TolA-binding protein|nr:hypothetical protein [Oscillospiraceae bacterium]